jgi:hypothetical protein
MDLMPLAKKSAEDLGIGVAYAEQTTRFWGNSLQSVQGMFVGLFDTILGSGNVWQFIGAMLKRLVAQLAAAAAMALLLSAVMPMSGGIGSAAKALSGGTEGFRDIFKFLTTGINIARPPEMARGGMVTGLANVIVGDNPSGKEAIIPFERMGEFLSMVGHTGGKQEVVVSGVLRGEDIFISSERYINNQNRRLGL